MVAQATVDIRVASFLPKLKSVTLGGGQGSTGASRWACIRYLSAVCEEAGEEERGGVWGGTSHVPFDACAVVGA